MQNYISTLDNVKDKLAEYGVAMIPNVLTPQECENMKSGAWDWLEYVTSDCPIPMNRAVPSTWKTFKELYPKHSMLVQQWGIGHAQFIWDVRTKPAVLQVFERIWNTQANNLLVSFDGASFHFPPEQTGFGWVPNDPNKTWLHSDQSYQRNGFECVQSWINAYDTNPGDATLTILEGSHRFHQEFAEYHAVESTDDWYMLNQEQIEWYIEKGCVKRNITCPAGTLVLWDSRTIHCGKEPDRTRPQQNFRCVAYLCYTPRSKATPKLLEKKISAFENLRTTSHWPHKPKLFPLKPHTYGKPLAPIKQTPPPVLEAQGLRLGGL